MVTAVDVALFERARRIRLVLSDCDGVLTDAGVWYSAAGEELIRFSRRDGLGVERLRTLARVETGIVSQEVSDAVVKRAQKLGLAEVRLGVHDKAACVREIAARRSLDLSAIAFLGDDLNDLPAMEIVGLSAAPADAYDPVRRAAQFLCPNPGGHGAFRDVAELILFAVFRDVPKP